MTRYPALHKAIVIVSTIHVCVLLVGCGLTRSATSGPYSQSQQDLQTSSRAVLQEGRERELAGDTDAAEAAYLRVLEIEPDNGLAAHRLAVLHDLRGDFAAASELYERALKNSQGRAEVLCDYGYSRYLREDYDTAEKALRQALEIAPSMQRASINLGLVAAQASRPQEAVDHFIRGGCTAVEAQANLASVQKWRGDRTAAINLAQADVVSAEGTDDRRSEPAGIAEERVSSPTAPVLRSVSFVP